MDVENWSNEKLAKALRERVMIHPNDKAYSFGEQVLEEAARRLATPDTPSTEEEEEDG